MSIKPFSQACENNKTPILNVLTHYFSQPMTVWEIGSGTGQHACYFAEHLPHLIWQPSDIPEQLAGIELWRQESALKNIKPALHWDVTDPLWPCEPLGIEALFTANTLHMMAWASVVQLFDGLSRQLKPFATVCIYGPFNYQSAYTGEGNARFDQWLNARDPLSGIRDFEAVVDLAHLAGLALIEDVAMPADNHLLVFKKNLPIKIADAQG